MNNGTYVDKLDDSWLIELTRELLNINQVHLPRTSIVRIYMSTCVELVVII